MRTLTPRQELVLSIINFLGCTEPITAAFIEQVLADVALFDRKQRDYGCGNISAFGEFGVLVRANDKLARLRHLHGKVGAPANEPTYDSWQDLSVYGVIARMCRAGVWPGVDPGPPVPPPPPNLDDCQCEMCQDSCVEPLPESTVAPDMPLPPLDGTPETQNWEATAQLTYWCPRGHDYNTYHYDPMTHVFRCDQCSAALFGPGLVEQPPEGTVAPLPTNMYRLGLELGTI